MYSSGSLQNQLIKHIKKNDGHRFGGERSNHHKKGVLVTNVFSRKRWCLCINYWSCNKKHLWERLRAALMYGYNRRKKSRINVHLTKEKKVAGSSLAPVISPSNNTWTGLQCQSWTPPCAMGLDSKQKLIGYYSSIHVVVGPLGTIDHCCISQNSQLDKTVNNFPHQQHE